MTLNARTYLAGCALQALLTQPLPRRSPFDRLEDGIDQAAQLAVAAADAALAALGLAEGEVIDLLATPPGRPPAA
jgi:hypothetical protein